MNHPARITDPSERLALLIEGFDPDDLAVRAAYHQVRAILRTAHAEPVISNIMENNYPDEQGSDSARGNHRFTTGRNDQ